MLSVSSAAQQQTPLFQAGVNKIGVAIDRIELKQIGLPRDMQRNMASEAEARVQAGAKLVASEGESEANNRLVEAGDSLDVVSIHLRSVSRVEYYLSECSICEVSTNDDEDKSASKQQSRLHPSISPRDVEAEKIFCQLQFKNVGSINQEH